MNLLFAKTYRTKSSEALCTLDGTTPIIIKAVESAKRYDLWEGHRAIYRRLTEKLNSTNCRTLLTSSTSHKPTDATTKRFESTQTVARASEKWELGSDLRQQRTDSASQI